MGSLTHSPKPPNISTVTGSSTTNIIPRSPLEKVMSMNGGSGECSYDRMSVVQAHALQILQPFISEAVHIMSLPEAPGSCPLRIADFGSATGRNAFAYVDFLVNSIRWEYESNDRNNNIMVMPEVQVFFNDLPGNDFNTMFGLLPPVRKDHVRDHVEGSVPGPVQLLEGEVGAGVTVREYFAAGVPGSFYGRLFPKESLHFAICMHCLHWISQVPAEVTDPESELYNRGSCWIMGAGKAAIARAFAEQSQRDFRKFLQCRAAELAPGGILQCFLSGRADLVDPTNQTIPERRHRFLAGPDFEGAWDDLIAEGIIMEETRDSFNLPIYIPHADELRHSITTNTSFDIIRLELLEDVALYPDDARLTMIQNPNKCARFYSAWVRALVEPIMAAHMGAACTDVWFVRHERRIHDRCRAMEGRPEEQEEYKFLSGDFLLLVLKKKL